MRKLMTMKSYFEDMFAQKQKANSKETQKAVFWVHCACCLRILSTWMTSVFELHACGI